MYGVPADLDLSRFKGAALIHIHISEFQVDFDFQPNCFISVEGKWELRDSGGVLIDWADRGRSRRSAYRLHLIYLIVGKRVESYSISSPDSFSLRFESGHALTVFDDSEQYESFSIQPGDIFV